MKLLTLAFVSLILLGGASCTDRETTKAIVDAGCKGAEVFVPTINPDPAVQKGLTIACTLIAHLADNVSAIQFDSPTDEAKFLLASAINQQEAFSSLTPAEFETFKQYVVDYE